MAAMSDLLRSFRLGWHVERYREAVVQMRILPDTWGPRPVEEYLPPKVLVDQVRRLAFWSFVAYVAGREARDDARRLEASQTWWARHFDWPARHRETMLIGAALEAGNLADSFRELGHSFAMIAGALGSELDVDALLEKAREMERDGPPDRLHAF